MTQGETVRTFYLGDGGYDWIGRVGGRGGWRVESAWGREGWDLGSWPLVCVALREDPRPAVMVYTEGDVDTTTFDSVAERDAFVDRLARDVWSWNQEPWLHTEPADALRGPYSRERSA